MTYTSCLSREFSPKIYKSGLFTISKRDRAEIYIICNKTSILRDYLFHDLDTLANIAENENRRKKLINGIVHNIHVCLFVCLFLVPLKNFSFISRRH